MIHKEKGDNITFRPKQTKFIGRKTKWREEGCKIPSTSTCGELKRNLNQTDQSNNKTISFWGVYRILEKGVRDTDCRRGSGGILTWKIFKIEVLGKFDFWHSEAKSACYDASVFNLGARPNPSRSASQLL